MIDMAVGATRHFRQVAQFLHPAVIGFAVGLHRRGECTVLARRAALAVAGYAHVRVVFSLFNHAPGGIGKNGRIVDAVAVAARSRTPVAREDLRRMAFLDVLVLIRMASGARSDDCRFVLLIHNGLIGVDIRVALDAGELGDCGMKASIVDLLNIFMAYDAGCELRLLPTGRVQFEIRNAGMAKRAVQ